MRILTLGLACMAVLGLLWTGCAGSRTASAVPGITVDPTGVEIPGKVVWLDLVTDDLAGSKKFYGELFGWQFDPVDGVDNYVVIRNGGERVGGILEVKPGKKKRVSQWLAYISVADVERAVELYTADGGELHHGPLDIPGRGRAALVTDAQGAYVALLRSSSGDPLDRGTVAGEHQFMWIDYVAGDTEKAIEFLGRAFGWEAEIHASSENRDYYVFNQGDRPRAGMFENPWDDVRPNWLPYVRVADASSAVSRAVDLGGTVVLEPADDIRDGSVGVVLDPAGAGFVVQKYPFEGAE